MKISSDKTFSGSKPKQFYGEGYFLRAEGSNYGRVDENGKQIFTPYNSQSYLPHRRILAKRLVDLYKPKKVMVLGCARGYTVQAFHEAGADSYGVDISEWAIKNCAPQVKDRLFNGDICDLSRFKDNSFDMLTALDVFEHITVPDLYTALDEATRICKTALVIDVPTQPTDEDPDQSSGTDKSHVSVYSSGWWIKQLTERGWILHAKDEYKYPEQGSQGATIIFVKPQKLLRHKAYKNGTWEKPKVDIIMLNYNGLQYIPKCVESLYHNTQTPFNLIIVDNQSTDGSRDWLDFARKSYRNMTVILNAELDSGYAAGVNAGLKMSKAPYVVLLNNDTIILTKGWLKQLLSHFGKDHKVGITSPKLLYPNKRIQYAGATFNSKGECYHIGRNKNSEDYLKQRKIPTATFACVVIKRDLILDGLDENYLLGTWEDVDFCTDIRFKGYKIIFDPTVIIGHYEGATQFTRVIEHFRLQISINHERFAKKWWFWLRMNMQAYPEVYADE